MARLLIIPVAALLLVAPSSNAAPKVSVAVVSIRFDGDVSRGVRKTIARQLSSGFAASGMNVPSTETLRAALGDQAKTSCAELACLQRVWVKLGARYAVAGKVHGEERSYAIELWITDTRTGKRLATVQESCEICGLAAVAAKADLAASSLAAKVAETVRLPARIHIIAEPPDAEVLVDGKAVGHAPMELRIPSGSHTVELRAVGYLPLRHALRAAPGVHELLQLAMIRAPVVHHDPYRTVGWISASTGAAAMVAAIALFAVDGQALGCESPLPGSECPQVRDTSGAAWTLATAGTAALIAGSYWLFQSYRERHRPRDPTSAAARQTLLSF